MVWYNNAKALLFDGSYNSAVDAPVQILDDATNIALLKSGYSVDIDTHVDFDDTTPGTNELSGTNYSTRGAALSGKALTVDTANDRAELDATDLTWSSLGGTDTFTQIVVMRMTPTTANSNANTLLIAHSTVSSTTANGGDVTLQFDGDGLLQIS